MERFARQVPRRSGWHRAMAVAFALMLVGGCGGDRSAKPEAEEATSSSTTSTTASASSASGESASTTIAATASPRVAPATTGARDTIATSTTGTSVVVTTTTAATTGTSDSLRKGDEVDFDDLRRDAEQYVGRTVEVTGSAQFLASCPPPGPGATQPCYLTGYLASPDERDFNESDTAAAFPIAEEGRRVGCPEPEAVEGGCAGWKNARRYRVVATVERQESGGRTRSTLQLAVLSKQLV